MGDDGLDKLLGNVDESVHFEEARQEELRHHIEQVRKSDRNILDKSANPREEMDLRLSEINFSRHIAIFEKGYVQALKTHLDLANKLKSVISDITLNENVVRELKPYTYNILRSIDSIANHFNNLDTKHDPSTLGKKAKKEYYLFFEKGDVENNHIDFIFLKEVFLHIRDFNSFVKKDWEDLHKVIEGINFISNAKSVYSDCNAVVMEATDFCSSTRKFISYIGAVLSLPEGDFDVLESEMVNKIIYMGDIDYSYKEIFKLSGDNKEKKKSETADSAGEENKTTKVASKPLETPEKINSQKTGGEPGKTLSTGLTKKAPLNIPGFTIKGTKSWNSKEPYILNINQSKYENDMNDLKSSILFISEKSTSEELQGKLKRALFNKRRINNDELIDNYNEFIMKFISKKVIEIGEYFGISDHNLYLFIYHVSTLTFYLIIKEAFETDNIAFCYKTLSDNKISKCFPHEYIKSLVNQWFETNINSLNLNFDSITEYNSYKEMVVKDYNEKVRINSAKAENASNQYRLKTGKTIDPKKLMVSRARVLFGSTSIFIYKRFIDRTIFK